MCIGSPFYCKAAITNKLYHIYNRTARENIDFIEDFYRRQSREASTKWQTRVVSKSVFGISIKIPQSALTERFFGIQIITNHERTAAMIQSCPGKILVKRSKTSIPIIWHSYAVQNHAGIVSAAATARLFSNQCEKRLTPSGQKISAPP